MNKYIFIGTIVLVGFLLFKVDQLTKKNEHLTISMKQFKSLYENEVNNRKKAEDALNSHINQVKSLSSSNTKRKTNAKKKVREESSSWSNTMLPSSVVESLRVRD